MYLFFDTETTGLPRSWKAPITHTDNWPRMVQFAWMLYTPGGKLVESDSHIIRPEGYTIPRDAAALHGISTEIALGKGEDLTLILELLDALVDEASVLVAHNMNFDEKIIGAEYIRRGQENVLERKPKICTMERATPYCRIPGRYGYKWPKLSELHDKLFRMPFEDSHNAAADIAATARCFWEMKRLGLLTDDAVFT
jgi:DNA polymerase III epsilon subunit-like protein